MDVKRAQFLEEDAEPSYLLTVHFEVGGNLTVCRTDPRKKPVERKRSKMQNTKGIL